MQGIKRSGVKGWMILFVAFAAVLLLPSHLGQHRVTLLSQQGGCLMAQESKPSEKEVLDWLKRFHGHLGPWVVFGWRVGDWAVGHLNAQRYFGVRVEVACPSSPPVSCLIDGLQVSTGATTGKANLIVKPAKQIEIYIRNTKTEKSVRIVPVDGLQDLFAKWLKELGDEKAALQVMQLPKESLFRTADDSR